METIRVVHINESLKKNSVPNRIKIGENGLKCGVLTKILTIHSEVDNDDIFEIKRGFIYKIFRKVSTIVNRIEYRTSYCKEVGVPFSYYNIGIDISKEQIIKEADIIVLHWICGSFISTRGLKKIADLHKPIIWVCHDNWPFTGGCHVRMGCEKFKDACGQCPQLKSSRRNDWSYRLLKAKKNAVSNANITVISPSTWMDNNVAESSLLSGFDHFIVPNPIDTDKFTPIDKMKVRQKYNFDNNSIIILFGAVGATATPYKGYSYLLQALELLEKKLKDGIVINAAVFGASYGDKREGKRISVRYLGYLSEEQMVEAYNLADVYVVPSLEDSFNNTVAEALACTTPVVAFATGGIKDIINHKENGYLAQYKDSEDLARGIEWVLQENVNNILGKNGREKVESNYNISVVAKKYVEIYRRICKDSVDGTV